ncbi:MAG: HDOD domain-containing protein [Planctomycetes bacterium]|nr:HDOD domain-containing protein [Planctomycetota bacterium]
MSFIEALLSWMRGLFGGASTETAPLARREHSRPSAATPSAATSTSGPQDEHGLLSEDLSGSAAALPGDRDAVAKTDEEAMVEAVEAAIRSEHIELPVLPATMVRVMEVANRRDCSAKEVADCIRGDAVIATEVIHVVNSAAFLPASPIHDLQRAVVHVGISHVRNLMLGVVSRLTMFRRSEQGRGQALWEHSIAVAVAAREIAIATRQNPDEAFLGGLLHDIGKTVILAAVSAEETKRGARMSPTALGKVLEEHHTSIGLQVAQLWKLPAEVADAIRHHHCLPRGAAKLAAVTMLANDICGRLGIGVAKRRVPLRDHPAFALLGLHGSEGENLVLRIPDALTASGLRIPLEKDALTKPKTAAPKPTPVPA